MQSTHTGSASVKYCGSISCNKSKNDAGQSKAKGNRTSSILNLVLVWSVRLILQQIDMYSKPQLHTCTYVIIVTSIENVKMVAGGGTGVQCRN